MAPNPFETDLDKTGANFVPLTPVSFIKRAARVYPDQTSIIYGETSYTWQETYDRCRRLASALAIKGVGKGDTVAVMAPNVPAIYEASFAVPMLGAVVNTLNVRLDAPTISYMLDHGEASVLITDKEFSPTIREALKTCSREIYVIDIDDPEAPSGECLGEVDYEEFLTTGDPNYDWSLPNDEWESMALNYTSGTTGRPKGVVYHHRGAYLNSIGNILLWNLGHHPIYLWTLPMFHCNGWCFPWTLAAIAGTSVCTRKVSGKVIYDAIADHGVTHFAGAPILLNFVLNATEEEQREFDHTVEVLTAAAPPPAAVLQKMEAINFRMTHVYGLTETYGPSVGCAWKPEWDDLPSDKRAELKARQGVPYHVLDDVQVLNPDSMEPVPPDGETLGEVMFRGNVVMKGFLKNPDATNEAFAGGWFHSGDLGVMHPDGYVQVKDRSKDIIISGGENISSIEVEDALYQHPEVLEAAVVARPDEKWGESPCAFVALQQGADGVNEEEIINFCRDKLARFKVPHKVVFGDLPKTSTGKIQKFILREKAKEL